MSDFDFATSNNTEVNESEDFIDIDTSDALEPSAVPDGEYKIRITGFQKKEGKIVRLDTNGNRYFMVSFDIPSEESSKGFSKFFGLPGDNLDAKKNNSLKWELEMFKRAFNLSELNFNSMIGREGYAILKLSSSDQYGEQNNVAKFVAGA